MFESVSPKPLNIWFYPDYRDFNPYQDLLYRSVGPTILARPLPDFERLVADQDPQIAGSILHLHWETAAMISGGFTPEAFLDALSQFRDHGGRIVWSMHNLMPHEERDRAVATEVRKGLLSLADVVHLHSLPALQAAMEHHRLPLGKVRLIPHGNYDGVYPILARDQARDALGLSEAGLVVLLPGQIRAYKSPAALAAAFVQVAGPDDRLILAGHRMSDVSELSIPDDPRLRTMFGFQTKDDLAQLYAAADFVVLPYSDSLTSGSAILAHTLGRAVLGSDTPGLRDVVQVPSTGLLYDVTAPDALVDALRAALAQGPEPWRGRGTAAAQSAKARDWSVLGATWRSVFNEVARMRRPARVLAP